MAGLNSILTIATGALNAETAAVQVTDNNIANANTPGYTVETISLSEASSSVESNGTSVGNGVEVGATTSPVDQMLNLLIQQATSAQTSATASSNILSSIQSYFPVSSTGGADIGSQMSAFFSSLTALSANPTSNALRQTAMSAAKSLASAFSTTSLSIQSARSGLNNQVAGYVNQINTLSSEIAALNPQIQSAKAAGGTGASTLENQRAELETQLSAIAGVSVTTTEEGDQISLSNGTILVDGSEADTLSTGTANQLTSVLDSHGDDITSQISGGSLGGTLFTRDTTLSDNGPSANAPQGGLLYQLDQLAWNFSQSFNAAQAQGYDLSGNAGQAIFSAGTGAAGAAGNISVASTATGNSFALSAYAGASNTGNNGNLTNLTAVENSGVNNPTDAYASIVDSIGNSTSAAKTQSSALSTNLTQLQDQQSSESGVSINDESSRLIVYQQAYQAAAQVISTAETLFQSTISMFSSAG